MRAWTFPAALFLAISALCSGSPAGAAQQSPSAAQPGPVLDGDRRLETRVNLRLVRMPLARVINDLAQHTGASIKAARSIAGEPTLAVVTDQPAREVMREIATLFHYRWLRSGEAGDYSYELVQDAAALREEEALRDNARESAEAALQAELGRRAEWARKSRGEVLAEIEALEAVLERVNDLPEPRRRAVQESEELQTLKQRAERLPALREMAEPLPRILVRLASGLSPGQWRALARGEVLGFSTRPTGDTLPLPGARVRELRSVQSPKPASAAGQPQVDPQAFSTDWARAGFYTVFLRLDRSLEAGQSGAALRIVPAAMLADEEGVRSAEAAHVLISGTAKRSQPVVGDGLESGKALKRVKTPRPLALDDLEGGSGGWRAQVLTRIADTYGIDVIADAYRLHSDGELPRQPVAELSLRNAVQRFVAPYAACTLSGEFLRVRRHHWYDDRLADLPDEEVARWAGFLQGRTALSLDETAALARAIHQEQWPELLPRLREHGIRMTGLDAVAENATPLRLYAALSPIQKEFVRSGGWLSSLSMPPSARVHAHAALRRWRHDNWAPGILRTSRIAVLTVEGAEPWQGEQPATSTSPPPQVTLTLRHEGQTAEHALSLPRVETETGSGGR